MTMKTIAKIFTVIGLAVALLAPVVASAQDASGNLSYIQPAAGGSDYGELTTLSYTPTGSPGTKAGIPSTVAAASVVLCTNTTFRLVPQQELAITVYMGATPTNALATTNVTYFIDYTPDGKVWTTTAPLVLNQASSGSNSIRKTFIVGATNFAGMYAARLTSISNNATAGAGSFWPSNVVFSQWKRGPFTLR